jgi:hypothetical protein
MSNPTRPALDERLTCEADFEGLPHFGPCGYPAVAVVFLPQQRVWVGVCAHHLKHLPPEIRQVQPAAYLD